MSMEKKSLEEYFNNDELAINVWKSKYAQPSDITPDDMHMRMAKEFAWYELKNILKDKSSLIGQSGWDSLSEYGRYLFKYRKNLTLEELANDIYRLLEGFKYIIPQGSVMATLGTNTLASLSNCVVIPSPLDSYNSIMYADTQLTALYKRRCGVGLDLSNLRPSGSLVNNAAKTTTGAVSFMERFSSTTREVAMNGRRGALMLTLNINHPDIYEFVKIKRDLTKVTGANISIKIDDAFMQAVESNTQYMLEWISDKQTITIPIEAKNLWSEIIKSAHGYAEPGLLFWGNMVENSPDGVYSMYKSISTNPCFRGDMKILTAYGYEPFESLKDRECDFVNMYGEIVPGTVWCSGIKKVYKLTTWNNKKIYLTADHILITTEGTEIKAIDSVGKRLLPYYKINESINDYTKLGFLQGDGNLTRLDSNSHLGLEVNIGEKDLEVGVLFNLETKGSHYLHGYNELLKLLKFSNNPLPDRSLPETFSIWNLEDKLMFFKGMYSANGSIVENHRISYKTTCRLLSLQIKEFLENIGISSYITTNKEKEVLFGNGVYTCKESYDVNISKFEDVLIFAEKISFIHKYKNEALVSLIKAKAPKVRNIVEDSVCEVYDFNLQDKSHCGIVEGIIVHNCSEIGMSNDSCRLMVVNLYSFVNNPFTDMAEFNFKVFYKVNYEAMRLNDLLVDIEVSYIDRIIKKIKLDSEPDNVKQIELDTWKNLQDMGMKGRRTGLGFTALGDTLAALNLKYDSEEALEFINKLMYKKLESELDCTIDLAIFRGSFYGWDKNLEYSSIGDAEAMCGQNEFYDKLLDLGYEKQVMTMCKYGRRNVSWSTVAPTGSLSILTQTTSGIEPLFQPFYTRRKKINPNDENVRIDFVDQSGDKWQEFPVLHPKFKDWVFNFLKNDPTFLNDLGLDVDYSNNHKIIIEEINKESLQVLFEKSPWYKATANDINWENRVKLQGIVQKYITHSISSTINLPSNVSEESVSDIYFKAWKNGLKGITVYRDGSRSGVLVNEPNISSSSKFEYKDALKRPKSIDCDITHIKYKGIEYTTLVGLVDNKPYEVFAIEGIIAKPYSKGKLSKKEKGKYDLITSDTIDDNTSTIHIDTNIASSMTDEQAVLTRLISMSLRHGADIKYIVEQLNKADGDLSSFTKIIGRVLKKYIPEGAKSTVVCKNCGSSNVVFEEGCQTCKDCGNSKCS